MGMCNITHIFQEKISELFVGQDTVRVYIDDLVHVTEGSWTENLTILEEIFTRLQKAGLKVNARKSWFGAHKFDYLGYHVTCDRVMPTPKKVKAIQSLPITKTHKTILVLIFPVVFEVKAVNGAEYQSTFATCHDIS